MDNAFRLSLLYLLLIVPQHGNSPIPRMESWVEMDQGDGFVDRDLTSSLTGVESFGSAHKNYQNSLIRKKQTDTEDELGNEGRMDKFSRRISDRMQRRAEITPNFMQNQYASYGYNNYLANNGPNQRAFQQPVSGINGFQDQRYRMPLSNRNEHSSDSKFDNRLPSSGAIDSHLTSKDMRSIRMSNGNPQDEDNAVALSSRSAKCSLTKTDKLNAEGGMMDMINREEGADESEYSVGSEETQGRVKNELSEDDLRDIQMEDGEEQDMNLLRYSREDEEDSGVEDSDYYNEMRNPAFVRGDLDVDYGQADPHGIIYKREETKPPGAKSTNNGEEVSQGSLSGEAKAKSLKETRSITLLKAEAPKEGREISKDEAKNTLLISNTGWPINSNVQSKESENLVRDSRRVFDNIHISQEKSPAKPQYHHGNIEWKADNYGRGKKRSPDEKRNKREDEDEQKNMKTGTDEGGGEYEDEEGKGHNDEEEYYEEAEISGGRGIRAKTALSDHNLSKKLYKRETGKDEEEKGSKGEETNADLSSEEYGLNLENAPVEHEDKSKKSSWREGVTRNKNVTRRGMKIWDEWGKWSPCSVTCGVGRKTRWRHCIGGGCARGEKEALIKKCTYPAC